MTRKFLLLATVAAASILLASCDGKLKSRYVSSCSVQGIPKEMCKCSYKVLKKVYGEKVLDDYVRVERMPDASWNASLISAFEECGVGKEAVAMARHAAGIDQPVRAGILEQADAIQNQRENNEASSITQPSHERFPQESSLAQCGKDMDCKGDRIYEDGQCKTPVHVNLPPEPVARGLPPSTTSPNQLSCSTSERFLFSCITTNQKQVMLCDAGTSLRYAFGRPGDNPEMNLSVSREVASMSHGPTGQAINIPTGNTIYSVFEHAISDRGTEAGVNVQVNGHHVAKVPCEPETIQSFMEGVSLKSSR